MFLAEASTSSFSPQYPSSPNFLPPRISTAGPKVATIFTRLFMIFVTPLYNLTFYGHFTSLVKVDYDKLLFKAESSRSAL